MSRSKKLYILLGPFQAFGVSFTIEDVENFGQYGLDDPVCTIDLTTEDRSYQILLGSFSTMDMRMRLAMQNHDEEEQKALKKEMQK